MNNTGEASLFFGIHTEPNQHLRRSSRIAERQAREAEAWSTCGEPSQSTSHANQVPRNASFSCDGSPCDSCSQTIAQCIEMLRLFHNSVDDALKLPEDECKDLIRNILQARKEWTCNLERQQNLEC
ncbi:hypothetical protein N7449_010362 [Penicillium cf. viridicatum]|uniref:Uncharacterized protein n=1 Tax=Penicillium cf. viridicatum TaxID=2972119 RepID=A0A9W9IZW7_9EURO|nr:hypothetical protein N7449_010362 [Penicillium cf. viridicatum]